MLVRACLSVSPPNALGSSLKLKEFNWGGWIVVSATLVHTTLVLSVGPVWHAPGYRDESHSYVFECATEWFRFLLVLLCMFRTLGAAAAVNFS